MNDAEHPLRANLFGELDDLIAGLYQGAAEHKAIGPTPEANPEAAPRRSRSARLRQAAAIEYINMRYISGAMGTDAHLAALKILYGESPIDAGAEQPGPEPTQDESWRARVIREGLRLADEVDDVNRRYMSGAMGADAYLAALKTLYSDTTPPIDAGAETCPKWTQDEAIAYECAREAITDLRAILSGQIADETNKPHPDAARLTSLRAERSRLFRERAGLHVGDHAEIARIRTDYGALIRAWRASPAALEKLAHHYMASVGIAIEGDAVATRQKAIDFARASVALEGFVLDDQAEALFARYVDGELTREELNAAVLALAASYEAPIDAGAERDRRKKAINVARASVALEGFTISPEAEVINQRFIDGDFTMDEYIEAVKAAVFRPGSYVAPIDAGAERDRRKKAIDFARASVELEGLSISPEVEAISQRYIDGELSGDEHVAAIQALCNVKGGFREGM